MDKIKKRREDNQPRSVNSDVIVRLLKLPDQKTFSGLRDFGLLVLTMDCGIRPKEAMGLKIKDFNFPALQVTIPAAVAKTRISRTLPISSVTIDAVRKLINSRHPEWGPETPVFCSADGTPFTRFAWSRRMRSYSEKLGDSVKPYSLRHSFALMYLRQGGNSFALQRTMGHADLNMTKRYLALTEGDLVEQHSQATPINILITKKQRMRRI